MGIRFEANNGLVQRWYDGEWTCPDEVKIFTESIPPRQFDTQVDNELQMNFLIKQTSSGKYMTDINMGSTNQELSMRSTIKPASLIRIELKTILQGTFNGLLGKFYYESNPPPQQLQSFTRRVPTLP